MRETPYTDGLGHYVEPERDHPDASDMAEHPHLSTPDYCLCGCGPDSTHHRRI